MLHLFFIYFSGGESICEVIFEIMCFLYVKIQDGRRSAKGKAQNDQFTVNQLKMLCALLFEVTKNSTSKF